MSDFLIQSLIASVVLTLLLNVIPRLFPKATRKAEIKVHEKMEEAFREVEEGKRKRVRVFFPFKTMLIASIILTILVNLVGYFMQR